MNDRKAAPLNTVIPGWRVFLSDRGRLWACRNAPFTDAQTSAGAGRTVDGDTLDHLKTEIDRQEEIARAATDTAATTADRQRKGVQWIAETPAAPQRDVARTATRAPADRQQEDPSRAAAR